MCVDSVNSSLSIPEIVAYYRDKVISDVVISDAVISDISQKMLSVLIGNKLCKSSNY
jgi:hypothetical protein